MEQAGHPHDLFKVDLDLVKGFAGDGRSGDEHKIDGMGQAVLVEAERFAEEAPGAIALHGFADAPAGDQAQPRGLALGGGRPIGGQASPGHAFALGFNAGKIASVFDMGASRQLERR